MSKKNEQSITLIFWLITMNFHCMTLPKEWKIAFKRFIKQSMGCSHAMIRSKELGKSDNLRTSLISGKETKMIKDLPGI